MEGKFLPKLGIYWDDLSDAVKSYATAVAEGTEYTEEDVLCALMNFVVKYHRRDFIKFVVKDDSLASLIDTYFNYKLLNKK